MGILTACGSNSSPGSSGPSYTGRTNQAVITADNALDISSKSMGVGFLEEIESASGIATQDHSKSLASSGEALTKSLTKASGMALLDLYSDVLQGELLPEDIFQVMDDEEFPNISGSYLRTVSSDDDKTFTITYTFTQVAHCSGTYDNRYIDTFQGIINEIMTFDYSDGDVTWTDETIEQKFDTLNDSLEATQRSMTCESFSHTGKHLWNPDTSEAVSEKKYFGGLEGYDTYYQIQEYSYRLDGTYKTDEVGAGSLGKDIGSSSWALENTFTGSLEIKDHYTDSEIADYVNDSVMSLSLTDGYISKKLNEQHSIQETDGLITESGNVYSAFIPVIGYPLPRCDLAADLKGNIALSSTIIDGNDKMEISLNLANTADNILSISKIAQMSTTDTNSEEKSVDDSYDLNADISISVSGNAQMDFAMTDMSTDPQNVENISLTVTSGKLAFAQNHAESFKHVVEVVEDVETTHTIYSEDDNYTASLSGKISMTQMDTAYLSFSGELSVESVGTYNERDDVTTQNLKTTTITMNNVILASNIFDVGFHGTIKDTVDNMDENVLSTKNIDLLFNNNGKTYKFSDYVITRAYQEADIPSKAIATYDVTTLTGLFYHPDYGYVDINTTTPFVMADVFPTDGTLAISGANGSQAKLDIIYTDYLYTSGYELTADADGDDEFEIGPIERPWPHINALLNSIWVIDSIHLIKLK